MALQLGKVVERIGAAQLTGMDQAHEKIARLRAVQGAIEQGILAMQHRTLQRAFAEIVV